MILQSLVTYYEDLLAREKLARPGWNRVKVSYALNLGKNGALLDVVPLLNQEQRGKKEVFVPREFNMPTPIKRTVGVAANFLWDNSSYLLGVDNKGKPQRAKECFEASKELHLKLLENVNTEPAQRIRAFFKNWDPEQALNSAPLKLFWDDILSGANLTFIVDGRYAHEDEAVCAAWQKHYDAPDDTLEMQCLVTGRKEPVAILHPPIKGVRDAQSSGASLVSFNARAYESYGREDGQGLNAPVSKYAAFAYGAALNYLLADREHTVLIGDTTVVFWAQGGEESYQAAFRAFLNGPDDNDKMTDADLKSILGKLAAGLPVDWSSATLKPENPFYILGLAPNAARLSVRLFLRDSFGSFAENVKAHYDRLEIVKPIWDTRETLPVWKLLSETVNQKAKDKTPPPQMAGDVLRAILTGARYPATLFNGVMMRISAEREITRGRAAIIKAYLLRNSENHEIKEVLTVGLNETQNIPYRLGRLFSILEQIQQAANPNLNATIKDKYFNSACATPSVVFPQLLKLKNSHIRVISREKTGFAVNLEKDIGDIMSYLGTRFPSHLSLEEQGAFILGYYHQTQKRYEKKNDKEEQ